MIPHPTTIAAVQEHDRRQLFAWVARDRRATSALGVGRRIHVRPRHFPPLAVFSTHGGVVGAISAWSASATVRRRTRPRAARFRGGAILARFLSLFIGGLLVLPAVEVAQTAEAGSWGHVIHDDCIAGSGE